MGGPYNGNSPPFTVLKARSLFFPVFPVTESYKCAVEVAIDLHHHQFQASGPIVKKIKFVSSVSTNTQLPQFLTTLPSTVTMVTFQKCRGLAEDLAYVCGSNWPRSRLFIQTN